MVYCVYNQVKFMSYDIITIGDTTTDILLKIDEATVLCGVNKDACELSLRFASKIPVKQMQRIVGVGNAANHAVGTTRLGLKTAIYTVVGNDDCGKEMKKHLKKEKVSVSYIKTDKEQGSNYSTVIDYKGDRTILVYHEKRKYTLPKFSQAGWLYFSSISGNHADFNKQLCDYVKKNKIKLGFNPGTLQMALGIKKIKPVISVCEVLFVNKEEAQSLTSKVDDIKMLLHLLYRLGPKIVVITDGQKGSYSYDGQTMWYTGIFELKVIERTGCGDAYASGFISALHYGKDMAAAMMWGTVNAGSAATRVGSQAGLLNKIALQKFLLKHKSNVPKQI